MSENNELGKSRNIRFGKSAISSFAQKFFSALISFFSVPLAVGHLGAEKYGVWMTIMTVIGWLGVADIGIGNSLSLKLSKAYAKNAKRAASSYVVSGMLALVFVSAIIFLCAVCILEVFPINKFIKFSHIEDGGDVKFAFQISLLYFCLSFPFSLLPKILGAYQEFVSVGLWTMASNIAGFVGIAVACYFKCNLSGLVGSYVLCNCMVQIAMGFWIFALSKPWLRPKLKMFKCIVAKNLIKQGGMFCLAGITWIINSQIDVAIIASNLGAEKVTPYSLLLRVMAYSNLIPQLLFGGLITMYAEAAVRKDKQWIVDKFKKHMMVSLSIAFVACLFLIAFGREFISMWAGEAAVPDFWTVIWMAFWQFILSLCYPIGLLLSGLGKPKGMAFYGGVSAILNLIASLFMVRYFGVAGVVAASAITCLFVNLPLAIFDVKSALSGISSRGSQDSI